MIQVYKNLFVGDQESYENDVKGAPDWFVVQACKEPYHRKALGYTGRAAPQSHPEYLWAERENRLILNLVDVPDPKYFSKEIMDKALDSIHEALSNDKYVFVHCNQGLSRSPGIALLYLIARNVIIAENYLTAEAAFINDLYPDFDPAGGIRGFLMEHWQSYRGKYA